MDNEKVVVVNDLSHLIEVGYVHKNQIRSGSMRCSTKVVDCGEKAQFNGQLSYLVVCYRRHQDGPIIGRKEKSLGNLCVENKKEPVTISQGYGCIYISQGEKCLVKLND